MEGRLVPPRGIELVPLRFQGVRGKGASALLKLPFLLLSGFAQAWSRLSDVRPDVVLGMGGYVAFPGGVVAALRGTPLVVHEQNAVAGTANKWLAKMARRVLSGFPGVLPKGEAMGNPVRADLCALPDPAERYAGRSGALRVLVVGGSLGALALNTTVPQALALMPREGRPEIVHQAGEQHLPALQQAYAQAGVAADCRAFIDDMAGALGEADLLICRAGAMTVSEVAAAGVAALFVPFPHAIDDHQTANARFLSDAQAAWLQPQAALTPEWLAQWLAQRTRQELQAVAERARAHARPEAAAHIADACEQAAGRSS
jgi:UDP-N-acetylglucosamine--N-acetylmuramyl-(pentapeptide) pyrophosphoryl-undecaprenol N-acetylglucosamine transferase